MGRVIAMQGHTKLFHIVATLQPPCRLASRLHSWKKQGNQNANDRNYNQKLNKSKCFGFII